MHCCCPKDGGVSCFSVVKSSWLSDGIRAVTEELGDLMIKVVTGPGSASDM